MHKIDHATAVAGQFTEGNPGGTPATVLTADWLNNLQGELATVVEASGATLDKTKNDQVLKAIMNLVYPVHSVYISQDLDHTPFQLFGVGTWVEICKGKVPVGLDVLQTEFDAVGKTGGAKTVTLGIEHLPEHNHPSGVGDVGGNFGIYGYTGTGTPGVATNQVSNAGGSPIQQPLTGPAGGGEAHDNLQPYEVVGRVWKRTA